MISPPPMFNPDQAKVRSTWYYRKITVYVTIAWCMILLSHLMLYGDVDSLLLDSIANNLILITASTIGTFVFGQVADDGRDDFREDNEFATWTERRLLVMFSMLVCGLAITYLIFKGEDSSLHQTMADGISLAFFGIHSTYVFASVWDDRKLRGN